MMQNIWGVLAEFAHSDLGPDPAPDWYAMLSVQMSHILIGATLALCSAPTLLVWVVYCGWVAKELLGDIPNAGGAWLVVADSVADLCFGALGYIITKSRMEKDRNGQV